MPIIKHIEVVRSNTVSLSSMGIESALTIVASLSKKYTNVVLTMVDNEQDMKELINRKPDLVFLGMMYVYSTNNPNEKIWLSEQLEQASIPCTGSPKQAHVLELNKSLAKMRMIEQGVATAPFRIVHLDGRLLPPQKKLDFPLFLKPLSGGGGSGIDEYSVVHSTQEFNAKILSLQKLKKVDVLVEKYLEGREFSIAVIKDLDSDRLIAMPIELIAPKDSNGEQMLSNYVKHSNTERVVEVTDPTERKIIDAFAISVFRALGARDYGRIDIRFDEFNQPHFLEANLIPSLVSGYGSFPKACKLNQDVDYDEMIANIASLGLSRTA